MENGLEGKMFEKKLIGAVRNSVLAIGVAAIGMAVGLSGCASTYRVPIYGPNGPINSGMSCFAIVPPCGGDSYKKMGQPEVGGDIIYETCDCYDPTPPSQQSSSSSIRDTGGGWKESGGSGGSGHHSGSGHHECPPKK